MVLDRDGVLRNYGATILEEVNRIIYEGKFHHMHQFPSNDQNTDNLMVKVVNSLIKAQEINVNPYSVLVLHYSSNRNFDSRLYLPECKYFYSNNSNWYEDQTRREEFSRELVRAYGYSMVLIPIPRRISSSREMFNLANYAQDELTYIEHQ